jgi:hypothetical protein
MRVAFIYNHGISSVLTKIFTGSGCYHVGFTDGAHFWDMNLIRRRRVWLGLYDRANVRFAECPVDVSRDYLESRLETDDATYGWRDYMLFALRPLYHLFGRSTRRTSSQSCRGSIPTRTGAYARPSRNHGHARCRDVAAETQAGTRGFRLARDSGRARIARAAAGARHRGRTVLPSRRQPIQSCVPPPRPPGSGTNWNCTPAPPKRCGPLAFQRSWWETELCSSGTISDSFRPAAGVLRDWQQRSCILPCSGL